MLPEFSPRRRRLSDRSIPRAAISAIHQKQNTLTKISGGIDDVAEIAGSHSRGAAAVGRTDFRRTGSCAGSLAARATGRTVQVGEDGVGYERIFGRGRGNAVGDPEGWNHGRALQR